MVEAKIKSSTIPTNLSKGIDALESLEILEDKDTVKEVYPDMTTVDILKILKAVKKMDFKPERVGS